MKSILLSLTFSFAAIACFAQPRWYNSYESMQSAAEIRSAVIPLDNARSVMLTGGNAGMVDINGDWVWQKKIAGAGRLYDGLALDDGTIVLVGYANFDVDGLNQNGLFIHAISENGDAQWSSGFGLAGKHMSGLCVKQESDSTLLIGGYVADQTDGSQNLNGMLVRVNHQGELLASKALTEAMAIQDLEPTANGGIAVGCLGQNTAGSFSTGQMSYFGFDLDLEPQWWFTVDGGNGSAVGIAPFGNNFAIAGTISSNAMILEVNTSGLVVDNGVYDFADDIEVRNVGVTNEGALLVGLDQQHDSQIGGDAFRQPALLSLSTLDDYEVAAQLLDGTEENRLIIGVGGLVDGSFLVGAREGNNMGLYKLFPLQPLPGCALGQPNLAVLDNQASVSNVSPIPSALDLSLSQESTPSLNSFSTDVIVHCGGDYCELEVQVISPDPSQCSGSFFEFLSPTEGLMEYNWFFDGEQITTTDSMAFTIDDWGFFEVELQAYDGNYCYASDVLSVTVLPSPEPLLNVPDSVALCAGETVLLALEEEYDFYTWSNASIQPTITVGIQGEYSVTVTAENNCQATSDTVMVYVGDYPTPTVELEGENPFCSDDSVIISTQEYDQYEWTFGQESQSFETAMPGPYFVIATSDLGCVGISDTLWLDTLAVPTPFVMADGPLTWCLEDGVSVGLGANESYDSVVWSNNVSDSSISVSSSGLYSYLATTIDGCQAYSDTVAVLAWLSPTINLEELLETAGDDCDGQIEISILAETAEYEIVWTDYPDETGLTLTDLCYGNYTVTVTDDNGCSSTESYLVDTSIGVEEKVESNLVGFPNPLTSIFNVTNASKFQVYRLINNLGAVVANRALDSNEIDFSQHPDGIYYLQLFDGQNWIQTTLIKR